MEPVLTLVQSVRTDKFGAVTVVGSQYKDQNGQHDLAP